MNDTATPPIHRPLESLEADLNDLRVFVQVVESHSFTEAGRRLNMPRSTVSRRVAALEKRLGVRLLHRTTRKLELTDLGATYYQRCSRSLQTIADAEAEVKSAQAVPRGRLRVTAPNDMGRILAPMVARFVREYPSVEVDVELSQQMVDMVGEGFDAAIRASSQLPDSTLVARRIGGGTAFLYASPEYLERRGEPRTPHELVQHDCVILGTQGQPSWRLIDEDDQVVEVGVRPYIRANDPSFNRHAVIAGAGISLMPVFVASDEEQAGRLVRVLPKHRGFDSMLYFVYPSAKHLSATLRTFRDHVVAEFGELSFGA